MASTSKHKKRTRSAVSPQLIGVNKKIMLEVNAMSDNDVTPHPNEVLVHSLTNQLANVPDINLDESQAKIVKAVHALLESTIITNTNKLSSQLDAEILKHGETKEELAYTQLELEALKYKYEELDKKYNRVLNRVVESEMKSMKNNLIISGIPELPGEKEESLKQWLYKAVAQLGAVTPPVITAAHRLRPKGRGKPRDVIIRFAEYKEKRELFSMRYKLKELDGYKTIWLSEQFPPEIQEERKVLLAVATEARLQFPHLARKISVFENTLYIDSTRYKTSSLHLLPDSLQPIIHGYKQSDQA